MRIAMFSETYYPNFDGVATVIMKLSKALAERGHKIYIFAPEIKNKNLIRDFKLHPNIKVHRYPSLPTPGYETFKISITNFNKTKKIIEKFKPDVIHIHTPGTVGIMGIRIGKYFKKKIIMTYHTYLPDFLVCISPINILHLNGANYQSFKRKINDFFKKAKINHKSLYKILKDVRGAFPNPLRSLTIKLSNYIHNKADIVTTPSLSMMKQLKREKLKAPVIALSNGIDCDMFKPKKNYKNQNKIIHVGRISYEKSVDVVVNAMKTVLKEVSDATLDIYGSGPAENYLKGMVEKEKIDNVFFRGFVPHEKLPQIYREHDIFVTASTIETQGLVLLEAMASGLPVVGVNKLAIPDVVKNNVNGYLVKPFSAEKMGKAILKLIKSPRDIKRFGKKSIEIAREHDFNKIIVKVEELYRKYSSEGVG